MSALILAPDLTSSDLPPPLPGSSFSLALAPSRLSLLTFFVSLASFFTSGSSSPLSSFFAAFPLDLVANDSFVCCGGAFAAPLGLPKNLLQIETTVSAHAATKYVAIVKGKILILGEVETHTPQGHLAGLDVPERRLFGRFGSHGDGRGRPGAEQRQQSARRALEREEPREVPRSHSCRWLY
jgi:hypothetical protein